MPTLYLIDGSGYIFRAYHALPPLSSPTGVAVGAVLGFTNMLLKLREQHLQGQDEDYAVVVFDAARHTFRNRMYPQYKANRSAPPDDLVPQFALVREAADALSIPRVELADFEADDLIASYAKAARERGMNVVILSSDKDLMQLIGEGVSLFDPMKQKPIGEAEVREKFGVGPARVRDVLALIGDSSDNIPGVPGVGPKTAAELITQFGDLAGLLARSGEIPQPKRRELLAAHRANAELSYALIGLKDDVPLPLSIEAMALKNPEEAALRAFLARHGFKTLLSRLFKEVSGAWLQDSAANNRPVSPGPAAQSLAINYELVQDIDALTRWIAQARTAGSVAVDTETTSLNAMQAELVGVSLAITPGHACYIPLGHKTPGENREPGTLLEWGEGPAAPPAGMPRQLSLSAALAVLKPLLEDPAILKIGQNIKYDALVLAQYGIALSPVEDTMLLSYVLSAGLHGQGMDELAERYLGINTISYDEVTGTGRGRISFAEVPLERARDYAAEDADVTLRLYGALKPRVFAAHLLTLYETIERPLIPVIVAMERRGIKVNAQVLDGLSSEFAFKMRALEEEICRLAGCSFNVGSPKQLGEVLFDKLQLPGGKKSSKTGAYSTDNYVLEELAEAGHALPGKIIEWRQLSKLRGTYTEALKAQINPKTGRVHTSFAMAITSTGRLSSSDPNLQNIPIRTVEGKKIRHAFVAEPGHVLISADYSQVELRLLAHMADIPVLKSAFSNGADIHAITASQLFGVPLGEVSADLRRSAKTINFGIIYGMSAHGLAMRLNIGRAEAGSYIEQYFRNYPGIRDYMEATKAFARAHGYVETLFGRRCHVPGIMDKNVGRRQFSERAAINAPLQGTAADIIKRAMIRAEGALSASGLDAGMLLQVHDELVFEARADVAEAALALIMPAMEHAAVLSVPLTVESSIGENWGEH